MWSQWWWWWWWRWWLWWWLWWWWWWWWRWYSFRIFVAGQRSALCNPYLQPFAKQNCTIDDDDDDHMMMIWLWWWWFDNDDDNDGYWLEVSDRHRSLTCLLPLSLIPGIHPNYTSSRIPSILYILSNSTQIIHPREFTQNYSSSRVHSKLYIL